MRVRFPLSPFLYPILDTQFSTNLVQDAQKLIQAGVQILQIRAKQELIRRFYEQTLDVLALCAETQVRVIVNDQVDIALITEASGVHLGQEDFPPEQARLLLGSKLIGLSTHTPEQYDIAQKLPIDYIAIGPVYETTTKGGMDPVLGIGNIIPLLKRKSKPVVAIGGIRMENFRELLVAGVDGIALISELHRYGDIYDTACRMLEEINRSQGRS